MKRRSQCRRKELCNTQQNFISFFDSLVCAIWTISVNNINSNNNKLQKIYINKKKQKDEDQEEEKNWDKML